MDIQQLLFIADDVDDLTEYLRDCGCYGAGIDSQCNSCVRARQERSGLQNELWQGLEALLPEERERYKASRRRQKQAREEDELYDEGYKALKRLIIES